MATIPQITAADAPEGGYATKAAAVPLYFELNTNPDPVRVSPASGDPEPADFIIVGSLRGTSVDCRKITVHVPTGEKSPDLTSDLRSVTAQISLDGWTAATDPAAKTITFTPASGHATIGPDQGITIQLMRMRINTQVGSSPLRIDVEWFDSEDDNWDTARTVIDVGKFPADFELRNFIPEELVIDNGGSVKLNWEATGASSLKLLYDVAEVNVLGKSTWTVTNVRSTTVFYLRATVQSGIGTVERILSATVTVRVPDLEVRNLIVNGDLTAVTDGTAVRIRDLRGPDDEPVTVNADTILKGNLTATSTGTVVRLRVLSSNPSYGLSITGDVMFKGNVWATATDRQTVRIQKLSGPASTPLTIAGDVNVTGTLTAGGKAVLLDKDTV